MDYGESDRILTLFTKDIGKISAYARGARKSQKRFGGALEPFALIELTLAPGRDKDMWRLEEASPLVANEGMAQNLLRLELGSQLLSLIRDSLPSHAPDLDLFDFIQEMISSLSRATAASLPKLAIVARLRLLSHLGMAMGLESCTRCGRAVPKGKPVLFHPGGGGVVCTPCGGGPIRLEVRTIAVFQELARTSMEAVDGIGLAAKAAAEIQAALDGFIEYHLGQRR